MRARVRRRLGAAAIAAALVAAGPLEGQEAGTGGTAGTVAMPSPEMPLVSDAPVFEPVEPPRQYLQALRAETRAENGRPGPDYWQQRVDYRIAARLDPQTARLEGSGAITLHNRSPRRLRAVVLHLYQNVFSEGVPRNRFVTLTGGIEIRRLAVEGRDLPRVEPEEIVARQRRGESAGPGWIVQGTLAQVVLPEPVTSGDSVTLEADWAFTVSGGGGFRYGHLDHHTFNIAQWYPQVAVFDDVFGWDATPYLGAGEFYAEFGRFEVDVTVPEGWVVVGTGTLRNPDEVLTAGSAARLAAAAAVDTVVKIVSRADRAAGRATAGSDTGSLTWRFVADSVRDFAFAAGARYVWHATGAATGRPGARALIQNVFDPEVEHWAEATVYAKHSIEFFSDYILPYPYPQATTAYGPPQVNGMEYPMITFINRSAPGEPLMGVVTHELSHFWMPMLLSSKEAAYAWMDEGLTSFNESLSREAYYGEDARDSDMQRYLQAVRFGVDTPIMEHTDHVESGFGRVVAAYSKPAVLMHALRRMLGREAFDEAYRAYAAAWAFRHPMPWDFFAVMEEAAGRDLDWFWQAWFYDTAALDQAIAGVESGPDGVVVTVDNRRDGVMPVELRIETADGASRTVTWPAEVWAGTRRVSRAVSVAGEVVKVEIDPGEYYPDVDRSNNVWSAGD